MVLKFLVCLRSQVEITYAQIYSPLARFWPTPTSSVLTLSITQTTLLTSLMHFWLPSPNLFRTSSIILKQTFELFTSSCAVFTPRSRYSLKWVSSKAYHFLLLFFDDVIFLSRKWLLWKCIDFVILFCWSSVLIAASFHKVDRYSQGHWHLQTLYITSSYSVQQRALSQKFSRAILKTEPILTTCQVLTLSNKQNCEFWTCQKGLYTPISP